MRGLQVTFLNIPFRKTEEIILRLAPKLDIVNKDFLSPVFAVSSESDAQGINPSYIHHHAINLEPNFILVKIIAHDPGTLVLDFYTLTNLVPFLATSSSCSVPRIANFNLC